MRFANSVFRVERPCPSCRGIDFSALSYAIGTDGLKGVAPIAICRGCGLVALWPQPEESEVWKMNNTYFRNKHSDDQKKMEKKQRVWAKKVADIAGATARPPRYVLDFGAGEGWAVGFLRERYPGCDYVAVDASDASQSLLSRFDNVRIYRDLDACKQAEGPRFDVVVLNHVLEHVPDPVGLLAGLRAMLSKEGLIYVAVPNNGAFPDESYRMRSNWFRFVHLYYFTKTSLSRVAGNAGLVPAVIDASDQREIWAILRSDGECSMANPIDDYDSQNRLMRKTLRNGRRRDLRHVIDEWRDLPVTATLRNFASILVRVARGAVL